MSEHGAALQTFNQELVKCKLPAQRINKQS